MDRQPVPTTPNFVVARQAPGTTTALTETWRRATLCAPPGATTQAVVSCCSGGGALRKRSAMSWTGQLNGSPHEGAELYLPESRRKSSSRIDSAAASASCR